MLWPTPQNGLRLRQTDRNLPLVYMVNSCGVTSTISWRIQPILKTRVVGVEWKAIHTVEACHGQTTQSSLLHGREAGLATLG
jgi:hypothetical protein